MPFWQGTHLLYKILQRPKFIRMKGHFSLLQTVYRQAECIAIAVCYVSIIPIGSELRAKTHEYIDKQTQCSHSNRTSVLIGRSVGRSVGRRDT